MGGCKMRMKNIRVSVIVAMLLFTLFGFVFASTVPEYILVNPGTFQMGNTRNDREGYSEEKPVHMVNLTYDYWIGKYEVTFTEYDAYCAETGKSKPGDEGWGRGTRPVINVSWNDVVGYCNWLSEKEGLAKAYDSKGNLLDRNGKVTADITQVEGYRLPTEAEWEYAARGGTDSKGYKYAGSNDLNEVGWYWENWGEKNRKTQTVGQKKANELGLYDMSGNVWEWCHDWYGGYASTTQTNPTGPSSGSGRVLRGGSWRGSEQGCRAAYRGYSTPPLSIYFLGFRVVRTVVPSTGLGPIEFVCPQLEEAIRKADGYTGSKTGPIYPEDVLGIITLNSTDTGITSLEGIQYLTNLQKLWFTDNQVSDLTPLQALTNLWGLAFSNNQVSDLTPLQNLTNLWGLDFSNNLVSDLTPLQTLTNLEVLAFSFNEVSDLTPLQHLTNLQELVFSNNQVSDLTPLQTLTNLELLAFSFNEVSDLTPLQALTNLEVLAFSNNQVSDLTPLQHLTNLWGLDFSNNLVSDLTPLQTLTNLRGLWFTDNQVSDLTPLQTLTNLQKLWFTDNEVSSLTPLQNLTNLEVLAFSFNEVSDLTPLQALTNLEVLAFSNNQVSDLTPLQNLTNLWGLAFSNNQVSDLTPLQTLTNLRELDFSNNQVSDLTPLQHLTNLWGLWFDNNQVSDLTPLVNNAGIGTGDTVKMQYNNLDLTPGSEDMENINALILRGGRVEYDPQN